MSVASPAAALLERLAGRWRMRRRALLGARTLAVAAPVLAVTWVAAPGSRLLSGLFLALVVVALWVGWRRAARHQGPEAVARHLNRTRPEVQESCELVLRPEAELNLLGRLQRAKVETTLARVPEDEVWRAGEGRTAMLWLALSLAAGSGIVAAGPWLRSALAEGVTVERPARAPAEPEAPSLAGVLRQAEIGIQPPAYTGRPERVSRELEVEAEEGSRLSWRVELERAADSVSLVVDEVTRIELRQGDDGVWRGGLTLRAPHVYVVEVGSEGETPWRSAYSRLGIVADEPPTVELVRPAADLELPRGRPGDLVVEAQAADDYGLGEAVIVATLAAGSGESVRFRERRLDLGRSRSGSGQSQRFLQALDLARLGIEPGAELYLHVEVSDRRVPRPQTARSKTLRVRMAGGSGAAVGLVSGLPILRLPEFFRSQRQIILDTEKLLAERELLTGGELAERSQSIGFDQRALRFRYAGLLGEEFVSGVAIGEEAEEEFEEFADPRESHGSIEELLEELPVGAVHEHDSAAIATFFDDEVKAELKAALSEMWGAEGRLRSIDPRRALPHEYRALRHLKSAQEAERVYVRKVGFEPPPIFERDKRLTGDLDGVRSASVRGAATTRPLDLELERALEVLRALRRGESHPSDVRAALEAARRRLARGAADPTTDLAALEILTELLEAPGEGRPDPADLERVEGALWRLLPTPEAAPAAPGDREDSLHGEYLRRLEAGP